MPSANSASTRHDLQAILSLEMPIIVLLGERPMKLSDVVALCPGVIIELPKKADDELTLQVNNKPIGSGIAVKVGENFGIRLTFIGDLKSRIAAMGADDQNKRDKAADAEAEAMAEAMLAGQV